MSVSHRIRFENTFDDLVAFAAYSIEHSPTHRRIRRFTVWVVPAVLLVAFGAPRMFRGDPSVILFLLFGLVFVVLSVPLFRMMYARMVLGTARRMFAEGRNRAVLGWHELEVQPDALVERSEFTEGRAAWAVVERVAATPTHVFLYTQAHGAHVIPRDRVEGDLDAFLDAVHAALAARDPSPGLHQRDAAPVVTEA